MSIPYELYIARRYLKGRKKSGFINLITYISISGVAIGVAALIIVLSVMNGFESEVRDRIIGVDTHVRLRTFHDVGIENYEEIIPQIRDEEHIIGLSPYILDKGMIRAGRNSTSGVMVRGADPATIDQVGDLRENIVLGELELGLVPQAEGKPLPGIVVGKYIFDDLRLDIGSKIFIMSMAGVTNMFSMPPVEPFIVTGVFETGFFEYDNSYVFIPLETAQKLFKMGSKVNGIEIRLDDMEKAGLVSKRIQDKLGFPFYARTWFEMRQNLFAWMQMEKWAMFIILCLIILVAAFNIVSTLIMVVMDKTREIGILKSMGANDRSITRIFIYEGVVVGVLGTLIGSLIGFVLCWAQLEYQFFSLPGDVYFINSLPVKMKILDFGLIGAASLLICLLSSIYPAKRAAKLIPVDAIRYE